jgi:hypothetical protein
VPPSLLGRLSPEAKRDQGKHSSLKYLNLESILHIADMDMLCKGLGWARQSHTTDMNLMRYKIWICRSKRFLKLSFSLLFCRAHFEFSKLVERNSGKFPRGRKLEAFTVHKKVVDFYLMENLHISLQDP